MLSALIEHGHEMRRVAPSRGAPGLFCMARGAGFELRVNEIYSWDGLRRGDVPLVLIQHTVAGEGRLDFEGVRHMLVPGETMLVTFPHAHRYWLERGKSWEYFWIILSGREALRLAGAILAAKGPVLKPAPAIVDRLAGACAALLSRSADAPGAVSSTAYHAIAALYDDAFGAARETADLPLPVQRAERFVADNLGRPIDVGLLARATGLSRAHFVRLFTAAKGQPPSDYVLEKRMERAKRLLLATDAPVKTVAGACGFADANYFSKAFRRFEKRSPGAFRTAGRAGLMTTMDE